MATNKTEAKTITVKQGLATGGDAAPTKSYYAMSSYSSWGVTPDLKLKPEIAAPGGNVYSSVLNNKYAYYSGTSMAVFGSNCTRRPSASCWPISVSGCMPHPMPTSQART